MQHARECIRRLEDRHAAGRRNLTVEDVHQLGDLLVQDRERHVRCARLDGGGKRLAPPDAGHRWITYMCPSDQIVHKHRERRTGKDVLVDAS